MSTCDCGRAESNQFARLFIDIASALVKESEFEGKIALRQAIRMYGGTIGRMRKEFMINAGQKTNLKHAFDDGWGIPCTRDGAVREWIEKSEEQLFVNILECPFARVWNEEDAELGHAFCEEFYPAYIKAASNEKAQINLGKTLTNEGDEFCRISCYLRRTNMSQDENAVCFPDCDPAFIEKEWNDSPMDDAARCAVLKECFRHILENAGLRGTAYNIASGSETR